jgi:hypothetical protein
MVSLGHAGAPISALNVEIKASSNQLSRSNVEHAVLHVEIATRHVRFGASGKPRLEEDDESEAAGLSDAFAARLPGLLAERRSAMTHESRSAGMSRFNRRVDTMGGMRGISKTCAFVAGAMVAAGACGGRTGLSLDEVGNFAGGSGGVSFGTTGSAGGAAVFVPTQGAGGSVAMSPVATGGIATNPGTMGGFTGAPHGSGGTGGTASSGGFANGGRSVVPPIDASTIVVDAAADAATGPAVIGPTHGGTCTVPVELPSADDVWWEAEWTKNAPPLASSQCGVVGRPPTAPTAVARWVAPRDGAYTVGGWSRNFAAVVSFSATCGDRSSACSELEPTSLPAVPFRSPFGSQWPDNPFKAGDVLFIWFQNDVSDTAPPDSGAGVVNIKRSG